MTRNRIKAHRRVRAGDLVPHELNFRLHPETQKSALQALYAEVGFARSLLAYELPDGRLKLIDGHLRRDLDPDMEVDVEILDLNDAEARALLLSIDPLAALAETQAQIHHQLLEMTPTPSPDLQAAWQAAAQACLKNPLNVRPGSPASPDPANTGCTTHYPPLTTSPTVHQIREQFLILITCRNEQHQVELLSRFNSENLECRALLS